MKKWRIQFVDDDGDVTSEWMESEDKPSKQDAAYEVGVYKEDIIQIMEL